METSALPIPNQDNGSMSNTMVNNPGGRPSLINGSNHINISNRQQFFYSILKKKQSSFIHFRDKIFDIVYSFQAIQRPVK